MHTHRLHPTTHAALLAQDRRDPVSGDFLKEGDEVVFCDACRSAFLKDSWEYLGKTHCGQRATLRDVPVVHEGVKLDIGKTEDEVPDHIDLKKVFVFKKVLSAIIDYLGFVVFIPIVALANFPLAKAYLILALIFLCWDIPFKRSVGKMILGFVITDKEKSAKASYSQLFSRGFFKLFAHLLAYQAMRLEGTNIASLVLIFFVFLISLIMGRSIISQLTKTYVIPKSHYEWYVSRAQYRRSIQL